MTSIATPPAEECQRHDGAPSPKPRLFEPAGEAPRTLEDAIVDAWDELAATGHAECPVCGGSLSAAGGCESCGAELS